MSAIALFERPFYFVRHGETETNLQGLIAGSRDVELTPLGREQARKAAAAFASRHATHVYSSGLRRALDTARAFAEALKLGLTVIPELAERNWGALEGQPRALRLGQTTPEGAETPEQFMERVLKGLAQVKGEAPLIVAHSGVYRVLCRTLGVRDTEAPVANAMPVVFTPLGSRTWKVEPV